MTLIKKNPTHGNKWHRGMRLDAVKCRVDVEGEFKFSNFITPCLETSGLDNANELIFLRSTFARSPKLVVDTIFSQNPCDVMCAPSVGVPENRFEQNKQRLITANLTSPV